MVSRHLSRGLGAKIAKRVKLSPVVMESTHDLDFVFWLLEPAKPVRVYSQGAYGYMQPINGSYDVMWSTGHHGQRHAGDASAAAGTCRRAIPISARPGSRSPAPRAP